MNIISNAVKYNKEKGEILLSYYETQVDDRHILFEFHCKDTGVGMNKEFQNHIFEPFTQETSGARVCLWRNRSWYANYKKTNRENGRYD